MRQFLSISLTLLGLLWGSHALFAQRPTILRSDTFPQNVDRFTWLWKTSNGHVYHCDYQGNWDPVVNFRVTDVSTCNALVTIHYPGMVIYCDANGSELGLAHPGEFTCADSIAIDQGKTMMFIVDNRPYDNWRRSRYLTETCSEGSRSTKAEIVNGIPCYCVPKKLPIYMTGTVFDCKEMHNWGMLGVNAQWVIEPHFDAPFHFKNGVAEVIYYGQKRKINAQGEFIQ